MKKVLFHVHQLDDWPKAIASATNAMNDLVNLDVVILANGPAVQIINHPNLTEKTEALVADGATINLCGHALAGQQIAKEDVDKTHFTYVPSGVVELIERQEDGYAYIRA